MNPPQVCMITLFSVLIGYILAHAYETIAIIVSRNNPLVVSGYRVHHSLYGLVFLGYAIPNANIVSFGIGIGIILQHTVTDGFRFITKESNH